MEKTPSSPIFRLCSPGNITIFCVYIRLSEQPLTARMRCAAELGLACPDGFNATDSRRSFDFQLNVALAVVPQLTFSDSSRRQSIKKKFVGANCLLTQYLGSGTVAV